VIGGGAGNGADSTTIAAIPVSLSAESGWHQQQTLILLSILALAGVIVAPPLLSRRLAGSRGLDGTQR
ncbi:MAG: hypothetical protein JWL64_1291, partial [Frankiales bacterium]|nr:hypothetical protein [Frankiales bacterium]